jgi:hypothetical protein
MKYSLCFTALAATTVLSFPSRMFDASAFTDEEKRNVADIKAAIEADAEKRAVETRAQYTTAFNAAMGLLLSSNSSLAHMMVRFTLTVLQVLC